MSSQLFSPITLRGLTMENRVVVSPMCQYSAEDGSATDWHLMHLGHLALSGHGLLIIEASGVEARGRITHGDLGIYSDANEAALARVVKFCRQHGKAKIGIQLAHAGRKASAQRPWEGRGPLLPEEDAWETIAPSPLPGSGAGSGATTKSGRTWPLPRMMNRADMDAVRDAFVTAARRSDRIGIDLIELHMAHGYLMHSFLSPVSNQRNDEYGGGIENRMRFPIEVFEAVRAAWPSDKPLGVRISASDWVDDGWKIEDSVVFAREMQKRGCDYVCASSGGVSDQQQLALGPGYQVPFAERIRAETGIPTMAVGMILEPDYAESLVVDGKADMVALARGLLYDPRWPWHAAEALGVGDVPSYPVQYERSRPSKWPQAFRHLKAAE
jgi:2,4-dienoyl-CoA reductase-like NADH-dependent reductase (Old Yellow Enzyme family)